MTVGIEFRDDDDISDDDVFVHPKTKKLMDFSEASRYVEWQMRKDYFNYAIKGIKDGKLTTLRERLGHLRWSLSHWHIVNYFDDTKALSVFLLGYGKNCIELTKFSFNLSTPIISFYFRWKNAPEGYYDDE